MLLFDYVIKAVRGDESKRTDLERRLRRIENKMSKLMSELKKGEEIQRSGSRDKNPERKRARSVYTSDGWNIDKNKG